MTEWSCCICGWSSSSLPWRKISAHTSGSRSKTSCHSSVGLRPDRRQHQLEVLEPLVGVVEFGNARPLRVVEHPVEFEDAHERREEARGGLRELQPAAVGRQCDEEPEEERVVGHRRAVVGQGHLRERFGVLPGDVADERVPGVVGGEALHERRVDALTAAAPLAFVQRGEDAVQGGLRAAPRGVRRRAERGTGSVDDHAHRVVAAEAGHHETLVPLHVGEGAASPEGGHRRVHEARVGGCEVVVAEPEPLHDAGAERLDHDVGTAREIPRDLHVVGVVEVEHDALFAACPERERGLVAQRTATRAARPARPRRRSRRDSRSRARSSTCSTGRRRAAPAADRSWTSPLVPPPIRRQSRRTIAPL